MPPICHQYAIDMPMETINMGEGRLTHFFIFSHIFSNFYFLNTQKEGPKPTFQRCPEALEAQWLQYATSHLPQVTKAPEIFMKGMILLCNDLLLFCLTPFVFYTFFPFLIFLPSQHHFCTQMVQTKVRSDWRLNFNIFLLTSFFTSFCFSLEFP